MEKENQNDEKFIRRCIQLSQEAFDSGDNPFASLIVKNGKIIVEAKNEIRRNDVTKHAEIVAMQKAQKMYKTDDFSGFTIYSNCEPCPMCSFIMRELKFSRVVFSLESIYMGGFSKWKILQDKDLLRFRPVFSNPPEVVKGVLEDEAKEVFKRAGWTF